MEIKIPRGKNETSSTSKKFKVHMKHTLLKSLSFCDSKSFILLISSVTTLHADEGTFSIAQSPLSSDSVDKADPSEV
jgi:hypothetical protein